MTRSTPRNPTNPDLLKQVADRVAALKASGLPGPAPADPGDGLGQRARSSHQTGDRAVAVDRVAGVRGLREDRLRRLVQELAEGRQLGFLGVERVNVVQLNLALDNLREPYARRRIQTAYS